MWGAGRGWGPLGLRVGREARRPLLCLNAGCPFPQHTKNSKSTNKYEGWPEALEIEGCIPQKKADGQ